MNDCDDDVCITCSDQLLEVVVDWVSEDGSTARGVCAGTRCEISVELVDGVHPGDVLLAHGGVAIQRADASVVSR